MGDDQQDDPKVAAALGMELTLQPLPAAEGRVEIQGDSKALDRFVRMLPFRQQEPVE